MRTLDISTVPLQGMNLIEASAGTGKTMAITSLYLRLIIECDTPVKNILVVTYTRAATHELRQRIRQALQQTLRALKDGSVENDKDPHISFKNYVDFYKEKTEINLRRALIHFDEAAIFTIHGFCQRVLTDSAFESSLPFERELLPDETDLLREVTDDFWRREVYPARPLWVSWLQHMGIASPDDLLIIIKKLVGKPYLAFQVPTQTRTLFNVEEELESVFHEVSAIWARSRDIVLEIFETHPGLKKSSYPSSRVRHWITQMDLFLKGSTVSYFLWKEFKHFNRFRASFLNSYRAVKKDSQTPRHPFFDACEDLAQSFERLEETYDTYYAIWRYDLLKFTQLEMVQRKSERHQLFYDDLLLNLNAVLHSSGGKLLAEKVRHDYSAVLVDEFQDTDPLQYKIFHIIYGSSGYPFFMVGDPKQAIYSFRGADIFSYLTARQHVEKKYTLVNNYRSVPRLVNAVNTLFDDLGKSGSFFFDDIDFSPARAVGQVPELREDNQRHSPLVFWPIYRDKNSKLIPKYRAANLCAEAVGSEIVRLLSTKSKLDRKAVQPNDIAILVRTHQQGILVEAALRKVKVPVARHVKDSVYETDEGLELERVLLAIVDPNQPALIKAALMTSLFGHDAEEISVMAEVDQTLNDLIEEFQEYRNRWTKSGFMRMFRELASKKKIFQRLLHLEHGERRLTNLLHLTELIQSKFRSCHDISAVPRWLSVMRGDPPLEEKESLLRLDSDLDRVKIVTLHGSKGLQFPIVFLPFAWDVGVGKFKNTEALFHDCDQLNQATVDFGSLGFKENQSRARDEGFAESLRLLYVGLTRAESRCYLAWGAVKGCETSALAWLLHRPAGESTAKNVNGLAQHFSELTDNDLVDRLTDLTQIASGDISIRELPVFEKGLNLKMEIPSQTLRARQVHKKISQAWSLTSFSSLTAGKTLGSPVYDPLNTGEGVLDREYQKNIFTFPKGAHAGIFIHKLFEEIDFADMDSSERQATVKRLLKTYGFEKYWLGVIDSMLNAVVDTPLNQGGSLSLSGLTRSKRINEMAFYYPISALRSVELYELLNDHQLGVTNAAVKVIDTMNFDTLPGFMTGFIDLVFEAEGRFWIVDYKSNHLGDSEKSYQRRRLQAVMTREHYVLQYLIYSLAVHRFLNEKLSGYEYDRHFGGVYYLFVRGIDPNYRGNGIFFDRLSQSLIEDLDVFMKADTAR